MLGYLGMEDLKMKGKKDCPSCGEQMIPARTRVCPNCNYEFYPPKQSREKVENSIAKAE